MGAGLRHQCVYSGVDYEMVEYEQGDAPDFSRQTWMDVKFTLGMDFPNLPYLQDGDLKISETWAIHKYLADKYKPELLGKDAAHRAHVNMLAGVLTDIKMGTTGPCYAGADKQPILDKMNALLPNIVKYLGDKKFLAGDEPTYIDFYFSENINLMEFVAGKDKFAQDFPTLAAYNANMKSLPKLKEYWEDPNCIEKQRPFNNKVAGINGTVTD